MKCIFDIEDVDDKFIDSWNHLTNNEDYPDEIEMDIDCIPIVGDSIEFDLTYGHKIVELSGKVKRRHLVDARNHENLREEYQEVYWWYNVDELRVCWLDTVYTKEK